MMPPGTVLCQVKWCIKKEGVALTSQSVSRLRRTGRTVDEHAILRRQLDILRRYVADESVDLVYLDPRLTAMPDYNVLFA